MSDYSRILITTDFSEQALAGVHEGVRLAKSLGSEVVLTYAVEDRMPPMIVGYDWQEVVNEHREFAERNLKEYAEKHLSGCRYETVIGLGSPAEVILRTAAEREVDLIVMATRGHGLVAQVVLGSTTERVLHRADCPVVAVRSR